MKNVINEGGINGIGANEIDTTSNDFHILRQKIVATSQSYTKLQLTENKVFRIKLLMINYLNTENSKELISVGEFFKMLLYGLGIKYKKFADYIAYQPSNLSAFIAGKRKINIDLAFKLSKIFNIHPDIWLNIQTKNELITLETQQKNQYNHYKLADLIEI